MTTELSLTVGSATIQPVRSVRDLGVQLDAELSMKEHVSKVASSCFYQLRRLRQIRRLVGQPFQAPFKDWTISQSISSLVSVSAPGRFVNSALQMLLLYCIVYVKASSAEVEHFGQTPFLLRLIDHIIEVKQPKQRSATDAYGRREDMHRADRSRHCCQPCRCTCRHPPCTPPRCTETRYSATVSNIVNNMPSTLLTKNKLSKNVQ